MALGCAALALTALPSACHRGAEAPGGPDLAVRLTALRRDVSPTTLSAVATPSPEGRALASQLHALSYLISQVQICQSLKPDADGISAPTGCIDLYRLSSPPTPTSFNANAARADSRYIDVLDPNQTEVLSTPVPMSLVPATTYAYGIVRWVGPAKVEAEVSLDDGSAKLFSHDGAMGVGDASGQSSQAPALSLGPASEALAGQGTQLSWFRLYAPLDLRASSELRRQTSPVFVDLVVDADHLVGGSALTPTTPSIVDGAGHSMSVPPLDLNFLPDLGRQRVRVETYVLRQSALLAATFDLRLSIYARDDEPDEILSLELRCSRVTGSPANPAVQKIAFTSTDNDNRLSLINHTYTPMISGLTRGKQRGDTSQAVLPCNGVLPALVAAGCTAGEVVVDVELADVSFLGPDT